MAATSRVKSRLMLWALAAVLCALFLFYSQRSDTLLLPAGVLRVGIDPSSPPFAFYDQSRLAGLEIELAQELGEQLGYPVTLVALGFDGLYDAIRAEQVDVVIASVTPDPLRTGDVHYSRPYFDVGLTLVSRRERPIRAMDALSGQRLSYAFGSAAHAEAARWLRRIQPFESFPYELPNYALDALRLAQVDAALVSAVDVHLYALDHPMANFNAVYVQSQPYVAMVSIDRPDLADAVDQALQTLQETGILADLIERWL